MPTEQELRDAVIFFKKWEEDEVRDGIDTEKHNKNLVEFAESVLYSNGWPEKEIEKVLHGEEYCEDLTAIEVNKAIAKCRLAAAKRELELQKEIDALKAKIAALPNEAELLEMVINTTCQKRWKEGNLNIVCGSLLPCPKHGGTEILARAISQRVYETVK